MDIFAYEDYRLFLRDHLTSLPKKGRGELQKISKQIGVHSTLLSLILNGDRDFSLEQAFDLASYLQLTEIEAEYFSLLVQYSRAGNPRYKNFIKRKAEKLRISSQKVAQRVPFEKVLTDEEKSIFYSAWIYSAIRLFSSTREKGVGLDDIMEKFLISRPQALTILSFLTSSGLLKEHDGLYTMAVQSTFLEQGSPHLHKHHTNWRLKAVQKSSLLLDKELMFTYPCSLSRDDFQKIREQVLQLIKSVSKTVKDSPAEDIACLNIDLFWIDR